MKIIGITGPSGSGKTTLSNIMKDEYNAYIIDADSVAKKLSFNQETAYFKKIVKLFGKDILNEEGNLNRKKMADVIFRDQEKREGLNNLTFKYVVDDILGQLSKLDKSRYEFVGIDVPLLYETKMERICDKVIAVIADENEKISRICERDGVLPEVAKQRLKIQNSNEFFAKKADFVICNDGTFEKLVNSLKEIMCKI